MNNYGELAVNKLTDPLLGPSDQLIVDLRLGGLRQADLVQDLFPDRSEAFFDRETVLNTLQQGTFELVAKLRFRAVFGAIFASFISRQTVVIQR